MAKTNNLLIYGAIGLGAYLLLGKKGSSTNGGGGEKTYTIRENQYPNVPAGTYKESELVNYGFVEYPAGSDTYYHQTQFVAPQGTDTTAPTWLNYLNTAIQLGTTLYTTVTDVTAQANKKMKTTAVDWNNDKVTVQLAYGYASYNGEITPISNFTKTAATLQIKVTTDGQKVTIKFIKSSISSTGVTTTTVEKEGIIDFYNQKLTGFDAGSISGVYMAGYCNTYLQPNYDRPVNIMGIGSIKNNYQVYHNSYSSAVQEAIDYANKKGYELNEDDIFRYISMDSKRPKHGQTTRVSIPIYKNGVEQKKMLHFQVYGMKNKYELNAYINGVGSIYDYMHPKAITHCFDGSYSDAGKGACSYHGGAHEIKLRRGQRLYNGKGVYEHYLPYRKQYKKDWNRKKSDKVITI